MFFSQWSAPGGYREVLRVSLPLAISMAAATVMEFTDRVFLGNYSIDAIGAAMPAGIAGFVFMAFFMGMAGYVNVFIAQYTGSGASRRVGAALWQGIHLSLASFAILSSLAFAARPLFALFGHPPEVVELEVVYFRILTIGAGAHVLQMALGGFYSGRGLTKPVMVVNLLAATINIPLDYAMINGIGFFPEMGIAGAGLATVIAWVLGAGMFAVLIFTKENERLFAVRSAWHLDADLFKRLIRYGLPAGVQFFLDIFGITFFVLMVGRLGKAELVATNIAFSINSLAFMPVIGFHVGISILVGQAIGRGSPDEAQRATSSALHLSFAYMATVALLFVVLPEPLMAMFRARDFTVATYQPISDIGEVLLRFVALYTLFDALGLIYSGAVKGAGDTAYVMWAMAVTSMVFMVIPSYVLVEHLDAGINTMWAFATFYISLLGLLFWARYRQGKWKTMRVIETQPI